MSRLFEAALREIGFGTGHLSTPKFAADLAAHEGARDEDASLKWAERIYGELKTKKPRDKILYTLMQYKKGFKQAVRDLEMLGITKTDIADAWTAFSSKEQARRDKEMFG